MVDSKAQAGVECVMTAQELFGWGMIQGMADVARAGLEAGADASAVESLGALSYAVGRDWIGCVELALSAGANPEAAYHGRSLIERALEKGSRRCARALLPRISLGALASAALWQTRERPDSPLASLVARELSRREALALSDCANFDGANSADFKPPRL